LATLVEGDEEVAGCCRSVAVEETEGEEDLLKWGKLRWLRGWSCVVAVAFGPVEGSGEGGPFTVAEREDQLLVSVRERLCVHRGT
jgi:hypothetical protein